MTITTEQRAAEKRMVEFFVGLDADERAASFERINSGIKLTGPLDEVAPPLAVPMDEDYSQSAPAPEWVIEDMLERETVNLWAGDGGSAKSTAAMAAAVAAVSGGDWLGRKVHAERVVYIDEENPARVPHARLRALGMKNEFKPALRYFNRQGFQLGTPEWDEFLSGQLNELRPDLVIIDGAASATNVEVNENDAVTRLLKGLRAPASEFGCAIVLLHHARKPSVGQSDADGMNTMGARAWHNQADSHLTFRKVGAFETERREDGGDETRRDFTIKGHKVREGGEPDQAESVVVSSGRTSSKALEWMRVESGGPVSTRQHDLVAEITEAVCAADRTMSTAEIATAVEEDSEAATFRRALKAASTGTAARVEKVKRGTYAPTAPAAAPAGGLEF
jgi:hypothetical protein